MLKGRRFWSWMKIWLFYSLPMKGSKRTAIVEVKTEKWILAKFAEFEYAGDELGEILQGAEIGYDLPLVY
jgi:hypothetical protein